MLLKHLKGRENLKGAEKKRTLQKHPFGQLFLRMTPSPLLWCAPILIVRSRGYRATPCAEVSRWSARISLPVSMMRRHWWRKHSRGDQIRKPQSQARKRHINITILVRLRWDKPRLSQGQTETFSLFYTVEAQFVPGTNPVCPRDKPVANGGRKSFCAKCLCAFPGAYKVREDENFFLFGEPC